MKRGERKVASQAGIPAEEVISVDAIAPTPELAQFGEVVQGNMESRRYGISGRPDRIIRNARGLVPVDVKHMAAPRSGPYNSHLAQIAVYCLLIEDHYQCQVNEGVLKYDDRTVLIPFDARMRNWIIELIQEVQLAKKRGHFVRRNHSHRPRCVNCGFRGYCRESLP